MDKFFKTVVIYLYMESISKAVTAIVAVDQDVHTRLLSRITSCKCASNTEFSKTFREPPPGLEPGTHPLRRDCSTN